VRQHEKRGRRQKQGSVPGERGAGEPLLGLSKKGGRKIKTQTKGPVNCIIPTREPKGNVAGKTETAQVKSHSCHPGWGKKLWGRGG